MKFRLLLAIALLSATPALARGPASYPAPTVERMIAVPGGKVYVRVNGDPNNGRPPIIFVHGGPGGSHPAFLDMLALADERAVILYDQLDSGKSDSPGDPANWAVGRFVDELEEVRAALGIGRWHVVGHSWGGTVALEYAARGPKGLVSVVLASPLISTRSWLADANALRATLPADVRTDLTRCEQPVPPAEAVCNAATGAFMQAFNTREPISDGRRAVAKSMRTFTPRLYETMWGKTEFVSTGTLKTYDGEPLLARLPKGRTLFITGQYDEARPETVGRFAARAPDAEFAVVPGAAHGIFNDRPAETAGLLRAWMERHDQP